MVCVVIGVCLSTCLPVLCQDAPVKKFARGLAKNSKIPRFRNLQCEKFEAAAIALRFNVCDKQGDTIKHTTYIYNLLVTFPDHNDISILIAFIKVYFLNLNVILLHQPTFHHHHSSYIRMGKIREIAAQLRSPTVLTILLITGCYLILGM